MDCLFLLLSLFFIQWGWLWALNTKEWIFGSAYDCLFWIIDSDWKNIWTENETTDITSCRASGRCWWKCTWVQKTLVNVWYSVQGFLMFSSWMHLLARTLSVLLLLLQAPPDLQYFYWNAAEAKKNIWQITKRESLGKAEKSIREGETSAW